MIIIEQPLIPRNMLINNTDPIFDDLTNPPGCDQVQAVALPFDPTNHCESGIVQVHAQGGTPPYQYSWDNGVTFSANSTYTVSPGNTGYVIIEDSLAGAAPNTGNRRAIARWKIEERPRMQIVFDKRNFCEASDPDITGALIIKGLVHGQQGVTYDWQIVQTFDAQLNQTVSLTVASGTTTLQVLNTVAGQITTAGLTPGNYNLIITPEGSNCSTNVRFTICNNCADVSSDHPDQEGGCGCCGNDCIDDTHVNINLGN